MSDFGCSLLSEFVEEHVQRGFGPARSRPDETAGVVVDNNDQVTMSSFVGDLIDPDSTQTRQTIDGGFNIMVDAGDDRPNGPSRHPQQLTGGTLRCPHSEPGGHGVEVAGVANTVSRPRDLRHGLAVRSALDSPCLGFDKHFGCARIEATPASPACPSVIAG